MKKIYLPRTSHSGIELDNEIADIQEYIENSPQYKSVWEDYTSGQIGDVILRNMAFIGDQLSQRIDWQYNEFFLTTATQPESVLNNLKGLFNYRPAFEKPSIVTIKAKIEKTPALWPVDATNFEFPKNFAIKAIDRNGTYTTFEFLSFNEDGSINYEDLYIGNVVNWSIVDGNIVYNNTGTSTATDAFYLDFYSGNTNRVTYTCAGEKDERITVASKRIIEDSIKCFLIKRDSLGNIITRELLYQTASFIDRGAQQPFENLLPYKIELDKDRNVSLVFGNKNVFRFIENPEIIVEDYEDPTAITQQLGDIIQKLPKRNDEIEIWYRSDAGTSTNIVKNAINVPNAIVTGYDPDDSLQVAWDFVFSFVNPEMGAGGSDYETWEEAKDAAPLVTSTVGKTVTVDDYDIIINNDKYCLKGKAYGQQNKPALVKALYGITIKPMETWYYIIPNRQGWGDKKPSEYNDFFVFTSEEQFYLNKAFQWEVGEHNVLATWKEDPDTNPSTRAQNGVLEIKYDNMLFYDVFASPALPSDVRFEITNIQIAKYMFTARGLPMRVENIISNIIKLRPVQPAVFDPAARTLTLYIADDNTNPIVAKKAYLHYKVDTYGVNLTTTFGTKRIHPFKENLTKDVSSPIVKVTSEKRTERSLFNIERDVDLDEYIPEYRYEKIPWYTTMSPITTIDGNQYDDPTRGVNQTYSDFYIQMNPNWVFNEDLQKDVISFYDYQICKNLRKVKTVFHLTNDTEILSPHDQIYFEDILADPTRSMQAKKIYTMKYRYSIGEVPSETSPETAWRTLYVESPISDYNLPTSAQETLDIINNQMVDYHRNKTGDIKIEDDLEFLLVSEETGKTQFKIRLKHLSITEPMYFEISYGDTTYDPLHTYSGSDFKDLLYLLGFEINYNTTELLKSTYPNENNSDGTEVVVHTENKFDLYDDFHVFYIHFTVDRRLENVYFDSTYFTSLLDTKRLEGIVNSYKQPLIQTFDIKGIVYFNKIYSGNSIYDAINSSLRDRYSLLKINFGESIKKSEILKLIQDVNGVEYVELKYLGVDLENNYETVSVPDKLIAYFDEIYILNENVIHPTDKQYGAYSKGLSLQMIKYTES